MAERADVYAPVPEPRPRKDATKDEQGHEVKPDKHEPRPDKHEPKPDDSEAVAEWRQRMAKPEAKELYKQRAATAECVNAQARNRGLLRMPVRGLTRVRSVVGLFVLAHNLMRMVKLRTAARGSGDRCENDLLPGRVRPRYEPKLANSALTSASGLDAALGRSRSITSWRNRWPEYLTQHQG